MISEENNSNYTRDGDISSAIIQETENSKSEFAKETPEELNDSVLESTPFEQAIAVWSSIGLSRLQRDLDDQGVEILEHQKNSILTRKELASRTKTFRKLGDEAKILEIKVLLKLYQAEVDNLTQRSKFAETSFLNLYKLFAEAPDPVPLLEASVESVLTASEMNKIMESNTKLSDKLNKYADYEKIKAKLSRLEIEHSETIKLKIASKEAEMRAIIDEKQRYWRERESELEAQVQEARDQIKELRSNTEVLQVRLSAKSQDQLTDSITDNNATKAAGRIAELELVASDLERANKRMLEFEKRNVELRSELETARSGTQVKDKTNELESRISDLESENILLAAQLDTSRNSVVNSKLELQKRVETLNREIERKESDNCSLRKNIDSMKDYFDIKRELEVLKSIEFSYEETDERHRDKNSSESNVNIPLKPPFNDTHEEETLDGNDNEETQNNEKNKNLENSGVGLSEDHSTMKQSLERLMLARNKKLVKDLTEMRISKISLEEKITDLSQKIEAVSIENKKLHGLNGKLEEDLTKANDTFSKLGGNTGQAMSVVSGWGKSVIGSSSILGKKHRTSPTSSIIGGYDQSGYGSGTPENISLQSMSAADSSILPIVTQQRDRFRLRNSELEGDLRKSWSTIAQLRKDLDLVKRDNVKLYEKARYASSYQRTSGNGLGTNASGTEVAYRNIYEEGLSPYQQFKGRENERVLSKMGHLERALYSLTRIILVNRTSRNLFAGYCLALHFMVMLILMYGVTWHTNGNPISPSITTVVTDPEVLE